jgi:hypothetical protein
LKDELPKIWSLPTMSPHCADETKYGVVLRTHPEVGEYNQKI